MVMLIGAPVGHESKRSEQAKAEAPCAGMDARPGVPVAPEDAGGVTGRATDLMPDIYRVI